MEPQKNEKPVEKVKLTIVSPEKPTRLSNKFLKGELEFAAIAENHFNPPSPKANKVEFGPAQVDLKQWLGDSLKSIVRPNPRRTFGKMPKINLECHTKTNFKSPEKAFLGQPLIDHFVVSSLNALGETNIEFQYPSEGKTPLEIPQFLHYCFPSITNLGASTPLVNKDNNSKQDPTYSPAKTRKSSHDRSPRAYDVDTRKLPEYSFVNLIASETETKYLICVYDFKPSVSFVHQDKISDYNLTCWTLVTKYPEFVTFFDILYALVDIEHAYLQKLESEKKNRSESDSSEEDYNIETNASKKYEINPIIELIERLYQIPPPKIGTSIPLPINKLSFTLCVSDLSEKLAKFGCGPLFYMLPRQKIFKILSALMLECKILILSKNRHILSSVILGLCGLLYPFLPNHVIVPILGDELLPALGMNVPYIIGCCNPLLVLNSHILSCDIMVVDMDENLLYDESRVPSLPYENLMDTSVTALAEELSKRKTPRPSIPYYFTTKYNIYIDAIIHTIHYMFTNFTEDLVSTEIAEFISVASETECTTIFNQKKFLENKRKTQSNYEFFSMFVNTTNFAKYRTQLQHKMQDEMRLKMTPITPRSRQIEVETEKVISKLVTSDEEAFHNVDF